MTKQKTLIIVGIVIIAMLSIALAMLLKTPSGDTKTKAEDEVFYLLKHEVMDISYISVENENGFYDVKQEEGGFTVYDIPAELLNTDYLKLLLDETSRIAVREKVADNPEDLGIY
ncbi:MAG TPA: hypothetical protein VM577_04710, partial [Anaerovoracaceae bacterium]|nr:hypothetical protein [Anaerovoracaceae bacterium]